jgi:hypothetical protein
MVSPCLPHPAQRSNFKSKQAFSLMELFYYTTQFSASVFLEKWAENFISCADYFLSYFWGHASSALNGQSPLRSTKMPHKETNGRSQN